MESLSKFQELCEYRLNELLSSNGKRLEDRKLDGEKEIYITGKISGSDIQVWIYEDEALFYGGGLDCRFEKPDYDSGEDLIDAFISQLSGELRQQA